MDFKKKVGALGIASSVLFAAGIAGAAWTSNGTGDGTAAAGLDQGLTVTAATTDTLFPSTPVDVKVSVANPNPYNVEVSDFDEVNLVSGDAACALTGVDFVANEAVNHVIAANDTGDILTAGTLSMDADLADNDCQGVTFTVTVTANGLSTEAAS